MFEPILSADHSFDEQIHRFLNRLMSVGDVQRVAELFRIDIGNRYSGYSRPIRTEYLLETRKRDVLRFNISPVFFWYRYVNETGDISRLTMKSAHTLGRTDHAVANIE